MPSGICSNPDCRKNGSGYKTHAGFFCDACYEDWQRNEIRRGEMKPSMNTTEQQAYGRRSYRQYPEQYESDNR